MPGYWKSWTAVSVATRLGGREKGLGGGIYNENGGDADCHQCAISGNWADQGGGIYNGGSMQIASTTVSDNFVGRVSRNKPVLAALSTTWTLDISNSTITGNTATDTLQSGA